MPQDSSTTLSSTSYLPNQLPPSSLIRLFAASFLSNHQLSFPFPGSRRRRFQRNGTIVSLFPYYYLQSSVLSNHCESGACGKMADMNHSKYNVARDEEHPYRPLDPAEYLRRSCFNAHWPNKILLSVSIELLRHYYTTVPGNFETEEEEIELIYTTLQNRRLKPSDCTEDAVRFHFKNFNFPALTYIISKLSNYEIEALQDLNTDEPEHPIYGAFHISVQAILTGQLLDKDISDQPFDMSGLTTTLRRILEIARIQQFTALHGHCPNLSQKLEEGRITWQGYEEAKKIDDDMIEKICGLAQRNVATKYSATTSEEKTYCQKIFNDVGYHGIWGGEPAPFPWTKERGSTLAVCRPRARSV